MLKRIGVIGTTFGHPDPMDFPSEYTSQEEDYELSDMNDARDKLFQLLADSQELIRDAHSWKESLTRPESTYPPADESHYNDSIRMNSFDIVSDVSSHGLKVIGQHSQYAGPSHKTVLCETFEPVTEVQYSLSETLNDPIGSNDTVDPLNDLFRKTRLEHLASMAKRIDSGRLSFDALSPKLSALLERFSYWYRALQCMLKLLLLKLFQPFLPTVRTAILT